MITGSACQVCVPGNSVGVQLGLGLVIFVPAGADSFGVDDEALSCSDIDSAVDVDD
jgi:hypothetical protein